MCKLNVIGLALALMLVASASGSPMAKPLSVVTTVGVIGDAVERVSNGRAVVTSLIGTGVDPHTYRHTRSDVVKLGQADVVFCIGLFMEAQMESLLDKLSARQMVVRLGEELDSSRLLKSELYENKFDPHIWMDVSLWSEVVEKIRETLTELDSDGRTAYETNAKAYQSELRELDGYVRMVVNTIPEDRRTVITAHDAFGYFGRAYGIEVLGIQGISTESEAGLSRIRELVELIVERRLSAVFVESSVSERNVKALIEGAAALGHEVAVGAELFSDSMGTPGTYVGTYVGMLDHNATRIVLALGGEAPISGMSGNLGGI